MEPRSEPRKLRTLSAGEARTGMMRALVVGNGTLRIDAARTKPALAPGEAIIRTIKAGVSALDLQAANGLGEFSGVLGHEFVGVVESVERGAPSKMVNKRVVGAIHAICGQCDMCVAGLRNHCRKRTMLGLQGRDGCLAEWFSLPTMNLHAVPDSVDDDRAVFAHPLASAIQAARQLTIEGKPYITVLGDGVLGLLCVQVMARLNASVRLIGRHSENLGLCEKWGIKHRHVDDIGRRADQDIVVECTGSPAGLELAMQLVRPRGTIVQKTITSPKAQLAPGVDLTPLVTNELTLLGSRDGPMPEAVSMLAREEVDVVSLVAKRMKLSEGPAILRAAARPGMLKVIVEV